MLLCIPIKNSHLPETGKLIKKAEKFADILEIWPPFTPYKLTINKPIILKFHEIPDNFLQLLKTQNASHIDVDISTSRKIIEKVKILFPSLKIIISYHNFQTTPAFTTLKSITQKMLKNGADIVKIATFANSFKDSLVILKLLNQLNSRNIKSICLAMGEEGKFTRLAGQFLGNYLMYTALDRAHTTAPGQLTITEHK